MGHEPDVFGQSKKDHIRRDIPEVHRLQQERTQRAVQAYHQHDAQKAIQRTQHGQARKLRTFRPGQVVYYYRKAKVLDKKEDIVDLPE